MKDQPLTIEVSDGRLIISVGVETLKYCHNLSEGERDVDFEQGFRIGDALGFAKDMAAQLRKEQDDGTTPVHLLIDQAIQDAADDGSEHVERAV